MGIDATHETDTSDHQQYAAKCDATFKVYLNSATVSQNIEEIKAMQLELSNWFPGAVLLPPGTKVRYKNSRGKVVSHSRDDPHKVSVKLNENDENEIVTTVFYKMLDLGYSPLQGSKMDAEEDKALQQAVDILLTPALSGAQTILIGFSEFLCFDTCLLEREYWYWVSLNATQLPIPLTAGYIPLQKDLSLIVVHVQYSGKTAEPSEVSRASLRLVQTVELRAHRDKCNPCRRCRQRQNCPKCQACSRKFERLCFIDSRCTRCSQCSKHSDCCSKKLCASCKVSSPTSSVGEDSCRKCWNRAALECLECKDCVACRECLECSRCLDEKLFTSCELCDAHFDCDNCRDYKWAKRYGVQLIGPHAGLEHTFILAEQATMHMLGLNDCAQRRFALLIGNSQYCQCTSCANPQNSGTSSHPGYQSLGSPVVDVDAIAERLQQSSVGFEVEIVRNATKYDIEKIIIIWTQRLPEDAKAMLFFAGHGCEVHNEQYFVPLGYADNAHSTSTDDAVAQNARENYVGLKSVLSRVRGVLRRDGLIVSFWDCCRENELKPNKEIKRGDRFSSLIRGLEAYNDELDEFSAIDWPAEIYFYASSPSCMAFDAAANDAHSPFTSALLFLLSDPVLAASDILSRTVKNHFVQRLEKQNGGKQRPQIIDDLRAHFAFVQQGHLNDHGATTLMQPPINFPGSGGFAATMGANPKPQESVYSFENLHYASFQPPLQPPKKRTRTKGKSTSHKTKECDEIVPLATSAPYLQSWPRPFCVLLIGANRPDRDSDYLDLKKECRLMQESLFSKFGRRAWRATVEFKDDCSADAASCITHLFEYEPSILQFSCHGDLRGLWLSEGRVEHSGFLKALVGLNTDVETDLRIRLVIVNACMSGWAEKLSAFVDFAIGHADCDVLDKDAITFSSLLFKGLGQGFSLNTSFNAAKMVSKPFCLYWDEKRCDPKSFFLPVPTGQDTPLDTDPVIIFLTKNGLSCENALHLKKELGLVESSDLRFVDREQLDSEKLKWLEIVPRKKLWELCCKVTGDHMSPDRGQDTEESQSSTPRAHSEGSPSDISEIDSDSEENGNILVVARNSGECIYSQKHMRGFVKKFCSCMKFEDTEWATSFDVCTAASLCGRGGEWTSSMILWIHLIAGAKLDESQRSKWLNACNKIASQDRLLSALNDCLLHDATFHKLWVRDDFESRRCDKKYARCIFIIDKMLHEHLSRKESSKQKWISDVVQNWFDNDVSASDFLLKANTFLRDPQHSVDGMHIFESVVDTTSYAAFMQMPKLAASLLFGYLEVCKLQFLSSTNISGDSCDLLYGFCSFVSSVGHVFGFDGEMPTRSALPTIIQGLSCIAQISDSERYMLGSVKTASEFVLLPNDGTDGKMESDEIVMAEKHLPDDFYFRGCMQILELVSKSKYVSEWVMQKAVERPMDFRTVKDNLEKGKYRSQAKEFYNDIVIVFQNVELFYDEDLSMHQHMTLLKAEFEEAWATTSKGATDRQTALQTIFCDKHDLIHSYLLHVKELVGSYVESASGEVRQVDSDSVALELFPGNSFNDKCGLDEDAEKNDFKCPISGSIMQEPVTCSDGKTYERAWIKKWIRTNPTSPFTREHLDVDANKKLKCESNVNLSTQIKTFKEQKLKEFKNLKHNAEGEVERRFFCSRYGYTLLGSNTERNNEGNRIDSAEKFLGWMIDGSVTRLACLTGPPASGKTVTTQQIVSASVNECSKQIAKGIMPFLPVFMRAAELAKLIPNIEGEAIDLRQLVEVYVGQCIRQLKFPTGADDLILELFDLDRIFICIDGLDEAAAHQELVEGSIENAVKEAAESHRHVRVLLSTRKHSYDYSRECLRLLDFSLVHLQPIDKDRRFNMIRARIPHEKVEIFHQQLASIFGESSSVSTTARMSHTNSELVTNPFLLSLMIEVYKKEGAIPTQRVDLYSKQVEGVVSRWIQRRVAEGETNDDLQFGALTGDAAALSLSIEFLESIAFCNQMQWETRDFKLDEYLPDECFIYSASCYKAGVELNSSELFDLVCKLLFETPVVGLLTCVGGDEYRFSHLTLQEYLAAKCCVRQRGQDGAGIMNLFFTRHPTQLFTTRQPTPLLSAELNFSSDQKYTAMEPMHPLHSFWKREVLQFTACMLSDETVFTDFCKHLLAEEEGVGAHCEIVQDFLSERGKSEEVSHVLRNKIREIRTDKLIAGLCHRSQELRTSLISELRNFRALDPFEDGKKTGIVGQLKTIVETTTCKWNTRVAAIVSITQIAQIEHGHGKCRTNILEWMLRALTSGSIVSVQENVAIVKGLGTLFKHAGLVVGAAELSEINGGRITLTSGDDTLLLRILDHTTNLEWLAVAVADLRLMSDGLVDWLLGNAPLISRGTWPMKHVRQICDHLTRSSDVRNSMRLSEALIRRLHALSFEEDDRNLLLDSLRCLYTILPQDEGSLQVLDRLKIGMAHQRIRVLQAAEELKMKFSSKSADQLAECMLLELIGEASATGAGDDSLLDLQVFPVVDTALSIPDMNNKSLLTCILNERVLKDWPGMMIFLGDVLDASADVISSRARIHVVSVLVEFHLTSQCALLLYDIITQVELDLSALENFSESHKVNDEIQLDESKFNSLPSVVTWNHQNCHVFAPPPVTLLTLEEIMGRTIDKSLIDLMNPIRDVAPELRCVCAMIWESTGLIHQDFLPSVVDQLQLTAHQVILAKNLFGSLQIFEEPWAQGFSDDDYSALLDDLKLADVIFTVVQSGEKQRFPAHWFVLAPRSEYFRDLFDQQAKPKNWSVSGKKEIPLDDTVSAGALKVLFRFLYTFELPEDEDCGEGLAPGEMVHVANLLNASGLDQHCQRLFVQGITINNAIERLVIAHDKGLKELQGAVMGYLYWNSHKFQKEAMTTLDILKKRPDLLDCTIGVTNALCSGLAKVEDTFEGRDSAALAVEQCIADLKSKSKYQGWVWEICNALKLDELGRFVFTIVLQHIRKRFQSSPTTASRDLQPLAAGIVRWKTNNTDQEVEKLLLLKEMCIGQRAMQMMIWTDVVSAPRNFVQQGYAKGLGTVRNEVDAFFSNPREYDGEGLKSIDVKTESVLMSIIFQDSKSGWYCNINTNAMINDFHTSIMSAKQRNVRIFHLGGHAGNGISFLWNADKTADRATEFNDDSIALVLGTVAGKNGPMECAVLNACYTYKTGKLIRSRGMPHVICWHKDVADEISMEFTEQFYRALLKDSTLSLRNYKLAFFAATGAMQKSKRTGPTVLMSNGATVLKAVRGKGGGIVKSMKNCVSFLSDDGDSEPVWL